MNETFSSVSVGGALSLLLVDDHTIFRECLRRRLELEPDFKVVGEAADGSEAVMLASKLRPGVVIMDISLPRLNGLEATRQIMRILPTTRVLILSAHGDDAYVARAAEVGAASYLLKSESLEALCEIIREAKPSARTRSWDSQEAKTVSEMQKGKLDSLHSGLTSREVEILQLIAEGYPNKGIAAHLGITLKTVGNHREHIMAKLDIHDAAGLTRYAIRTGIIESGGLGGMLG